MPIIFRASGPLEHGDEWLYASVALDTRTALDLFAFVGLPDDTFGGCEARELAPLLRRALWPARRASPEMRDYLMRLLDLVERSHGGFVLYAEEDEAAAP
jgi:hypothetical protein